MTKAFRLEETDGHIAILTFDQPGSKVNTLCGPVFEELAERVAELETREDLRGLLLRSGKPGQFIAGADLKELAGLARITKEEIATFVNRAHELFDRISQLPWPTVSLVDGPCLGGGTELALATDYRIASDNPKTRFALPEVTLGIIPSWGGTQRLVRLIDVAEAVEMICSSVPVPSAKAATLGLVSDVVSADRLVEAGCELIERVLENGEWESQRRKRQQPIEVGSDRLGEICASAERDVMRKTKGHYPAPLVALRTIRQGGVLDLPEALKVEQAAALELMGTTISANLMAVFFMKQRLARDTGVADREIVAGQVQRVGVLGAGLMGAGIAAAFAARGIPTALVDVDQQRIDDGRARIKDILASRIESGRAAPESLEDMFEKVTTSAAPEIFADCDLVVEAIPEDLSQKAEVYQTLAATLGDTAILASNTSTISIDRLAESSPDAERFIGMHFFNPVDRMQLVEVVRGDLTSDETVATIVALAKRIGKTPIVVRDGPGFLVNRILFRYLNEAVLLLLEGASMDAIDLAATDFGMPMGPILLHDVIGLDTVCYANSALIEAQSDRAVPLPILDELVQAGRLGQKSGAGFRKYDGKKSKGSADPNLLPLLEKHQADVREIADDEITDRLFLPMLLEATRVLEENIVREPADVDMGLILGIGFPTFRGGILRWCDIEGADELLRRVERYNALGSRFQPTETLQQLAGSAGQFYPQTK